MRRRDVLRAMAALPCAMNAARAAQAPDLLPRLAAAWHTPEGQHLGVLARQGGNWHAKASLGVPTRAHGIVVEPEGSVLAVARRPGDWLVRWEPSTGMARWHWSNDGERSFNGHARRRGALLYTTETDLDSGDGRVVVRDAQSLVMRAAWPSGGADPHDLRFGADGTLWVANGGIQTRPETGRAKLALDRMDSSLVRLDPHRGHIQGQWRLDDPRLSLRHLAWHGDRLAVALQAEHDDASVRAAAPVLALFDGSKLRVADVAEPLAGYAGDVVAAPEGFVVSVPRAGAAVVFDRSGAWLQRQQLAQACPLAVLGHAVFVGGEGGVLSLSCEKGLRDALEPALRLDNHWQGYLGAARHPQSG